MKAQVPCAIFIMISFDAGSVHGTHDVETRLWVGAVPNEISEESIMGASLFLRIFQNSLEGFKIRMNIGHDCELHCNIPIAQNESGGAQVNAAFLQEAEFMLNFEKLRNVAEQLLASRRFTQLR